MTDRLSEAAMLAVVLGDAGAPPDYNDWFCERCGKIFAQKGNLKRHWRQPRPCEICGWTTTFRDDKFSCYRSHHREDHQENGVPMQSVDQLRTYWKRSSHVNEIIDPINCDRPLDHNVAGDLLATDIGGDIGYGDVAGIEHPPSQSETENTLGEDAHPHTYTPNSSATALHPEDTSLWGNPATDHLTMLDDFQLSEWVYPSIPQPDGMITGLGSGTSSMPQMTGEREWLVAEIRAKQAELDELVRDPDRRQNCLSGNGVAQFDAYHDPFTFSMHEDKRDLEVLIGVMQDRLDQLSVTNLPPADPTSI